MFQAGIDSKIVRKITGHASDALNKYQITSNKQKNVVSDVLKGVDLSKNKEKREKQSNVVTKREEPSLELCVTETSLKGPMHCSCKRKSFDIGNGENLSRMIKEIVAKCKSGKTKIKLEIEFSD